MKVQDQIRNWLKCKDFPETNHNWQKKKALENGYCRCGFYYYRTVLAVREGNKLMVREKGYSVSTSRRINLLVDMGMWAGYKVEDNVDGNTLDALMGW